MPLPLLPILSAIAGPVVQGIQNRKNYKRSLEFYQIQRKDALADWNMQNEYNSPEQQMRRLKQAGLNPNLVYGNGADATSSSMPRQSNLAPTEVDLSSIGNAVNNYMNVREQQQNLIFKNQQTDNLVTQNALLKQKEILTQNQIIESFIKQRNMLRSGRKMDLDFDIGSRTKEDVIKSFTLKNQNLSAKTLSELSKADILKKDYENYDKKLNSALKVQSALTKNYLNQIQNRDAQTSLNTLQTNSNVNLNLKRELLVQAQTQTEPYKRKLMWENAQKIIKATEWIDATSRAKIITSYVNSGAGLIKNLNPKEFIKSFFTKEKGKIGF